jgi:hypothetical protein
MRARAVAGAVVGLALAASPAHAAHRFTSISLKATGSMKVVWHGDPAAGCEAAGMCDYRGSTTYRLSGTAFIDIDRFDHHYTYVDGDMEPGGATARVRRRVSGGPTAECRDSSDFAPFTLDVNHAFRDRYSIGLGTDVAPAPFVTGRCAGPLLSDFAGSLPTASFTLRDAKRRGHRIRLAGRFPFTSGPLRGEVISTLALRTRKTTTHTGPSDSGQAPHSYRAAFVEVTYAVERARADVTADFRAVESPACRLLDACGASGRDTYSFTGHGGSVTVFGLVRTHGRHPPKPRRALRVALRHGHLDGFGELKGAGATTDTLTRAGSASCTDELQSAGPFVGFETVRRSRLHMIFGPPDDKAPEADLLNGRCPGPVEPTTLRGHILASATIRLAELGRPHLRAVLARSSPFASRGYHGTRSARLELDLRRTHVFVGVERVFVFSAGATSTAQRP